jgi:hypothetical protein
MSIYGYDEALAGEVLRGEPPCGPLRLHGWSKRSIVKLCREVVRRHSPELADENWSDSGRQQSTATADGELLFELDDVALRTVSPGVREARSAGRFFVNPDWNAIERADADYENTLQQRRADGQILYFVEHGKRLRDGCHFIVTDPKWLLSQFFFYNQRVHHSATPYLWMQKKSHITEFWRTLRPDADRVSPPTLKWEAECVMSLLVHCGAAERVLSANAHNICFPVRLFLEAEPMSPEEIVLRDSNLKLDYPLLDADERDTVAYRVALFICAMCDVVSMPDKHYFARFFRQHVIVVDHFHEAALIVDFFSTTRRIRLFKDDDFECDDQLLATLVSLIECPPPLRNPTGLFRRLRTCCTGSCALCVFGDVVRALFLCEWGEPLNAEHHNVITESVEYAQEVGVC